MAALTAQRPSCIYGGIYIAEIVPDLVDRLKTTLSSRSVLPGQTKSWTLERISHILPALAFTPIVNLLVPRYSKCCPIRLLSNSIALNLCLHSTISKASQHHPHRTGISTTLARHAFQMIEYLLELPSPTMTIVSGSHPGPIMSLP